MSGTNSKLPPVALIEQQFTFNPPKNKTPLSAPWPKPSSVSKTSPLKPINGQFAEAVFKHK